MAGALAWRGACVAGSCLAKHAGQVASDRQAVVACAKSGEARLRSGGRWWRRKAAAIERGAWAAGGEEGVTASSQCGEARGGKWGLELLWGSQRASQHCEALGSPSPALLAPQLSFLAARGREARRGLRRGAATGRCDSPPII